MKAKLSTQLKNRSQSTSRKSTAIVRSLLYICDPLLEADSYNCTYRQLLLRKSMYKVQELKGNLNIL